MCSGYRHLAGNRTGVSVGGTQTISHTYDAADQVVGWTYDGAGNLTSDGATTYSYDALNHLTGTTTGSQSTAYTYNGDGTLVGQLSGTTPLTYTQDLAAAQSQILALTSGITTTDYLYGQDTAPLAALAGTTHTWYGLDGQGSVRQTLSDTGSVLGNQNYDPFGQVEAGSSLASPFGYTGELQDGTTGQEYLRARWYQPSAGTLLGVDPQLGVTGQPYAYAADDPVNGSDPNGQCTFPGGQLLGVEGTGSCAASILQALTGSGSTVASSLHPELTSFYTTLYKELTDASMGALSGQSFSEGIVLNPGVCADHPGQCSSQTFATGGAAGDVTGLASSAGGVVARGTGTGSNDLTGLYLGEVTGTSSRVGIAISVINGVVTLGISVRAPGPLPAKEIAALCDRGLAGVGIGTVTGVGGIRSVPGIEPGQIGEAVGWAAVILLAVSLAKSIAEASTAPNNGPPPQKTVYAADSNILFGRPKNEAYRTNPNNILLMPPLIIQEVLSPEKPQTAYNQRTRLVQGLAAEGVARIIPIGAPSMPPNLQDLIGQPNAKGEYTFGPADAQLMQTALLYGVSVLTDNAAMERQVKSNPKSARYAQWGNVPFVIP